MAITRRAGGVSGKECIVCREWKPFAEYTMIRKPGGNMKVAPTTCTQCMALAKIQANKLRNKTK